jgi:phage protein D
VKVWKDTTLGAVLQEIAARNGLPPKCTPISLA